MRLYSRNSFYFWTQATWWFIFYVMQQIVNSLVRYCVKQDLLFIINKAQSYQYYTMVGSKNSEIPFPI